MDSDDDIPELMAAEDLAPYLINNNNNINTTNIGSINSSNNNNSNKIIPVTLLTGYLGSGKSTLLNYLLKEQHGRRIAVIENEFSMGLGIEGAIAKSGVTGESLEGFFELNNGCICCTVKDSLVSTLEQLVTHIDRFDYILIETTGVANPGPIISSFWIDRAVSTCLKLDGVICVVDSYNFNRYMAKEETAGDVRLQIGYADRILMNKVDLVGEEEVSYYRYWFIDV